MIRLRAWLTMAVPVVAVTVVALILLAVWRDALPDPVATHFEGAGRADGFSSLSTVMLIVGLIGVGALLIGGAVCGVAGPRAELRFLLGTLAGVAVFIAVLLIWAIARQRGLSDATEASLPGWTALVAGVAGLAVGGAVAVLTPCEKSPAGPDIGVRPAPAGPVPATWSGRVSSGPALAATILVSIAVWLTVSVILQLWFLLGVGVVIIALVALIWSMRVEIDDDGVRVRSALGWPRSATPWPEIDHAEVADVHALRDFGGWGYRVGFGKRFPGVKGFVLRSGPGPAGGAHRRPP